MDRLSGAGPYPSGLLTIKLVIREAQKNMAPVGPNQILAPPALTKNPGTVKPQYNKNNIPVIPLALAMQATKDPLWKLMRVVYKTLKATSPNLTASCWLYYDIKPPFYESIGLNATYTGSASVLGSTIK